MNAAPRSTADGLGLDPATGGHDRLVVPCSLVGTVERTGRPSPLRALPRPLQERMLGRMGLARPAGIGGAP